MLASRAGQDRPHANHRRRPVADQERQRLQERRLRAAELFATGVRQAEDGQIAQIPANAAATSRCRIAIS
jgi:hypothetical protein